MNYKPWLVKTLVVLVLLWTIVAPACEAKQSAEFNLAQQYVQLLLKHAESQHRVDKLEYQIELNNETIVALSLALKQAKTENKELRKMQELIATKPLERVEPCEDMTFPTKPQ